jgi:hypothetical protein
MTRFEVRRFEVTRFEVTRFEVTWHSSGTGRAA